MKKKLLTLILASLLLVGCGKKEATTNIKKEPKLTQERITKIESNLGSEVKINSKKVLTSKLKKQGLSDDEVEEMLQHYNFNYFENAYMAAQFYKNYLEKDGSIVTAENLKTFLIANKELIGGFTNEEADFALSKIDFTKSPNKIKTKNDVWEVKNKWKLKINSVKVTNDRNKYSKKNPAMVVVINYSYENLGYKNDIQDLFLTPKTVIDEKGEIAETYPARINEYIKPTPIGAKTTGEEIYGLKNESKKIKIIFDTYDDNNNKQKAIFEIDVEN